ncbi:permease [Bacillus lacus]|uniref:Permease n=1 Tax=Metabacillus lacus TaxID=1983721 RepID=A0A7X2IZ33_9BACI|nr:permease [Metabacillus lacus]MRX72132.1 permease [Metabacillus lacus]
MLVNWKKPLSVYWLIFVPIISLYIFSERNSILLKAETEDATLNFWDVILVSVNDLYLIVYLMFPIFLLKTGHQLANSFEYTQLVRWGSYKRWIIQNLKVFSLFNVCLLLLWNLCSLVVSFGLPFTLQWSEFGQLNLDGNEILYTLSSNFSQPLYALILQFLLFFLAMHTIQLVLSILYVLTKSKRAIYTCLSFLYVMSILSFKVIPVTYKWLLLPNYLSLFHGVESFSSTWASFLVLILLLGIALISLQFIGRDFRLLKENFIEVAPIGIFIGLILLGIVFQAMKYSDANLTAMDLWLLAFFGTTHEAFQILSLSFYVIVFIGFVYFVQLFLQKQLMELSHYSIIRYESLVKWFWGWFSAILRNTIVFLLLLTVSTLIISVGFGFSLSLNSRLLPDVSAFIFSYQFFINGFLQITFYVLLIVLISWITKDVLKSFVTLLIFIVFMFPGINFDYLIPIGLNSMGQLFINPTPYTHSIVLVISVLAELTILVYLLRRKDFIL